MADDGWQPTVPVARERIGPLEFLRASLRRVRRRSFLKKTPEQQAASAVRRGELPRVLGRADLYLLSLGSVVGAGVFVLTGVAARDHAGPSVSLAYFFSAGAALLSAVCYLEFAVEAPRAGGAFSYVSVVAGELPAWVVASNLILEYCLSIAAVARAATAYACTLVGASSPSATIIRIGGGGGGRGGGREGGSSSSSWPPLVELDVLASLGILAITALLASGTAATARFNAVVTLVNLIAIVYIVVAAAPLANPLENLRPFAPEGIRGVFAASSVVFFAFVGFDTVATAAEDALDPTADLPVAIVGGVATAGMLYALLSLALCAAVPRGEIDRSAPFSKLFLDHHYKTAASATKLHQRLSAALHATSSRFVSFGALSGLVTAALVTVLGQARLLLVLGRERLLPAPLARLNAAGVPGVATWATGVSSAALALFLDLGELANLVSIGTLFVFACVALALLKRRHSLPGRGGGGRACAISLSCLVASSAFLSISFSKRAPWPVSLAAFVLWCASAASLYWLPRAYEPAVGGYRAPGAPLTPALSVLCNVLLIGSLPPLAHARFAAWMLVSLLAYVFYGSKSADEADEQGRAVVASVVELGAFGGSGGIGTSYYGVDGYGGGGGDGGLYSFAASDRELAEAARAAAVAREKAAAVSAAAAASAASPGKKSSKKEKQGLSAPCCDDSATATALATTTPAAAVSQDGDEDGDDSNTRLLLRVVRLSSEDNAASPTAASASAALASTETATEAAATITETTTTTAPEEKDNSTAGPSTLAVPSLSLPDLPSDALSPKEGSDRK